MEEQNQIIDAEGYRSKDEGMNFREIAMRQLQRVVVNTSQEMRKGFWIYSYPSPNMAGQPIKYVGDSRQELLRSIDCLHDLLLPKFDKEMQEQSSLLYNEFEECEESGYWKKTLKIYRKLFQQLCLFLERLGWLEGVAVEE